MEDIKEEWFYRPIPPFEDFFEEIEKALGFKLFIWQKTFIINGQFRQYGETTAKIIKRLTVDSIPIDLTQRPRTLREKIENEDLVKIYKKLQAAGVPTCPVFLTKKDKEDYLKREKAINTAHSIMDEMTLTLDSPITEKQWDAITDVDFEHTNEITFHTKHGKIVKFVKESVRPERLWIPVSSERLPETPIRVQVQLDNGWIITAYYDESEWYSVPGDGEPIDGVLAWTSLPEPYNGGEQNEQ